MIRTLRPAALASFLIGLAAFGPLGCAPTPSTAPEAALARAPYPTIVRESLGGGALAVEHDPTLVIWWGAPGCDDDQFENEYGLSLEGELGAARVCTLPAGETVASMLARMSTDERVAWAEPNLISETAESRGHSFAFDDGSDFSSGVIDQAAAKRVGLAEAHRVSRGRGVLVAVLDTGIDPDHRAFIGRLVPGYDFVDGDNDPTEAPNGIDEDQDGRIDEALGHGSHVAGIVAMVAPEARILPLRVLDDDGRGKAYDIARAIDLAVARGARVINLSLGMLVEDRLIAEAIARAVSRKVVVLASAGNWGDEDPEEFPADESDALAVAASGPSSRPAPFSSFGDHVAISAPGEGIRSAFWNGHTAVWSGTSMATPWVAGGAALLIAVHPEWNQADVLQRLGEGARAFDPTVQEASEHYGAGVLDLAAALAPDRGASEEPIGVVRPVVATP